MAFYSLGIPIGSLLGMLIGGLLAESYGWRVAFVVVGLPGIIMALAAMLLIRDPRKGIAPKTGSAHNGKRRIDLCPKSDRDGPWAPLFRNII